MKALIGIEGGMGKNVMFTALLPIIKKHFDEIYIVSPYYDIFQACSLVDGAFPPGLPNTYRDIALDDDCVVMWREPYNHPDFIKKKIHLLEAWLEEMDIEIPEGFNGMSETPLLDKIPEAFPAIPGSIQQVLDQNSISESKRRIFVQFGGGQSPLGDLQNTKYDIQQEGIKRNYYKGQELINKLKEEYEDAVIIQYGLPNEPTYDGVLKFTLPYLSYHLMARKDDIVVCTDSSLQHLTTGACDNVFVIWGETQPEHFGYSCNTNIRNTNIPNTQPYFRPLGASPTIVKFPSPQEVVDIIKENLK